MTPNHVATGNALGSNARSGDAFTTAPPQLQSQRPHSSPHISCSPSPSSIPSRLIVVTTPSPPTMPLQTHLTEALNLRVPIVQGGMQWVGVPQLVAAVCNAGGLGILTALTQPSPDALRAAIRETKALIRPEVLNRCPKYNLPFAVNITLLPSINPPDYAGYARAALEEGILLYETAGNVDIMQRGEKSFATCC